MSKLLPCPFCGGEAILSSYKLRDMLASIKTIECIECDAKTAEFNHHTEAKAAWNKRKEPQNDKYEKLLAFVKKIESNTYLESLICAEAFELLKELGE